MSTTQNRSSLGDFFYSVSQFFGKILPQKNEPPVNADGIFTTEQFFPLCLYCVNFAFFARSQNFLTHILHFSLLTGLFCWISFWSKEVGTSNSDPFVEEGEIDDFLGEDEIEETDEIKENIKRSQSLTKEQKKEAIKKRRQVWHSVCFMCLFNQ